MSGHDESNLGGSALKKKWQMITIMSLKLLFPKLHRSCVGQYFTFLFIFICMIIDEISCILKGVFKFKVQPHIAQAVCNLPVLMSWFSSPLCREKRKRKVFFSPRKWPEPNALLLPPWKWRGNLNTNPTNEAKTHEKRAYSTTQRKNIEKKKTQEESNKRNKNKKMKMWGWRIELFLGGFSLYSHHVPRKKKRKKMPIFDFL